VKPLKIRLLLILTYELRWSLTYGMIQAKTHFHSISKFCSVDLERGFHPLPPWSIGGVSKVFFGERMEGEVLYGPHTTR